MGNATIIGGGIVPILGPSANSTNFFLEIGGAGWNGLLYSSTEANTKLRTRSAGVISRIGVQVKANGRSTATTLKLRINGGSGNNSASITAATTGWFSDTTHSDTIADGDDINAMMTTGSGGGTITIYRILAKLVATTGTIQYFQFKGNDEDMAQSGASSTAFATLVGSNKNTSPETTELNASGKMRVAGTASRLHAIVTTNSWVLASSIKFRINGSDGNQVLSITGSTTGTFEDTTHSDTVAAGDLVDYSYTTPSGSGNLKINLIGMKYASGGTDFEAMGMSNLTSSAFGFSTSTPSYMPLWGAAEVVSQTEADWQDQIMMSVIVDKLRIYVSGNNSGTSVTATVRKNGIDTALTVSITNNATGYFEDTTHNFTAADTDSLNLKFTQPNSTSYSIKQVAVRMDTNVAGAAGTPGTQRGPGVLSGQ